MRKLFAVLALVALPALVSAQEPVGVVVPLKATPVSGSTVAADSSVAMVIKYFKPTNSVSSAAAITAKVAVEADGNLTFTVGGSAYTSFGCPFAGPTTGILDVSDGDCNTVGEVVDIINSSPITSTQGYFRAALVNSLRADVVSTQAWLADAADTEVERPEGEIIFWDSSALDDDEVFLGPVNAQGAKLFMTPKGMAANPADGVNTLVQFGSFYASNGGTVGDWTIYGVKENYVFGGGCTTAGVAVGSETVRTIAVLPAANNTLITTNTYFPYGFYAKDERVFMRVDSSGADTTLWALFLSGFTF